VRIITGSARGRKLKAPDGLDIRPTSDRVKESIFNAIQFDIEGRRVLDLFAGTGQLGIEALSRGARDAVFVDNYPTAVHTIRENLAHVDFEDRGEILQADAQSAVARFPADRFGLIFLDPPYDSDLLGPTIEAVMRREILMPGGLMVCESPREESLPMGGNGYAVLREYRYGKVKITLYTRE